MFHTPHSSGRRAALARRLGEIVLESAGWQAVAAALKEEVGSGFALRLAPEAANGLPATPDGGSLLLSAPSLVGWILHLPWNTRSAEASMLPLAEILGLATRLAGGLPLRAAEGEAALDPLPYAAILLDSEARVLFANAAGEDLLRCRRLFLPARAGARLRLAERCADEVLEETAARLLECDGVEARWLVRRPDDRTHLSIRLRRLGPNHVCPGAARLVLTLRSIGAARPPRASASLSATGSEPA